MIWIKNKKILIMLLIIYLEGFPTLNSTVIIHCPNDIIYTRYLIDSTTVSSIRCLD